MEERQRKQISAYVRLSDSNVASGATPIRSAVAHPIKHTVQSFDGLEDSSRSQRTRTQLSVAKDPKTCSIAKAQAQFTSQGPEDHSQYKKIQSTLDRRQLTGINPGKSHGQGPWVSHERHRLDDSSSANRKARSCSILLMGDMRL